MTTTQFKGNTVNTVADIPAVGSAAPDFTLVGTDMSEIQLSDYAGKWVLLNIFPSLDTGVCAASVREFNERAANLKDTVVLNVSMDLPFAQARFCGAEGIERAHSASAFRSSFGDDYGVRLTDSPMAGLLTRTVIVINPQGEVTYTQLVDEITTEPNYDEVMEHLGS
ncbi:thiol peroxidase [Yaniella flava]|uniref:Thiol peroxidase n=1 Tax=Yaniella flava TaxID=287930 RepID=A0ABN2U119_9MICC|nr:thiol peroxidase [Micrococcaceae bacterium]